MSQEKFVVAMTGSSFLASQNLEIVSFIHLSMTVTVQKCGTLDMQMTFYIPPPRYLFHSDAFPYDT